MIEQVAFPLAVAGATTSLAGIIVALLLACFFLFFLFGDRRQPAQE